MSSSLSINNSLIVPVAKRQKKELTLEVVGPQIPKDITLKIFTFSCTDIDEFFNHSFVCKSWRKGIKDPFIIRELFKKSVYDLWPSFKEVKDKADNSRFEYLKKLSKITIQFLCRYATEVKDLSLAFKADNHVFFDDEDLQLIQQTLPGLTELYIGDQQGRNTCNWTKEDGEKGLSDAGFKNFSNCPNLRSLIIKTKCSAITEMSFSFLLACTKLERLAILRGPKRYINDKEIDKLVKLTSLTELEINVADNGEQSINKLSNLKELKILKMINGNDDYWKVPSLSILHTFASLKNLVYLEFNRLRCLKELSPLEASQVANLMKNLKTLKISDCDLTIKAVAALVNNSNVEFLELKEMDFVEDKNYKKKNFNALIKELATQLVSAPKLRQLSLSLIYKITSPENDCDPIVKTLELSSSIQELVINYYNAPYKHIDYYRHEGKFVSRNTNTNALLKLV